MMPNYLIETSDDIMTRLKGTASALGMQPGEFLDDLLSRSLPQLGDVVRLDRVVKDATIDTSTRTYCHHVGDCQAEAFDRDGKVKRLMCLDCGGIIHLET